MTLEDYRNDMEVCCRCSNCKHVPLETIKGYQHTYVCPSISRYNFHAYSAGGRMNDGVALLDKRLGFSDKMMEIIYNCQLCGACDVSCKYAMDMDVQEALYETRIKAVGEGHTNPALDKIIHSLRNQGTMVSGPKNTRGEWVSGLDVKDINREKVDVIFHTGCLTSYNRDMWKSARATVQLLKKAEVNFGIAGNNEVCCGGRAYQLGYMDDFLNQAKHNMEMIKKSGARTLVTGCADCYNAFKVLYDKFDLKGNLQVLHITEYLARLLKEGKLKPKGKAAIKVTYHDPCRLGRLGEPWIHWKGKEVRTTRIFNPPKEFMRGTYGIYEPPRDILRSIPGLKLVEMDRIKEYAWCCGAGGGVSVSNPDFSRWTARERIGEAESTGAEALVTACPWCIKNFDEAIKEKGSKIAIYDIVEMLEKAI
jgi:Fe-S oxidoreductase